MPRRSAVTSLANYKIVAAERAFPVMTRHAALGPASRMMVQRLRRGHLSPLRHSRPHLMTFCTGELLMLPVVEADSKRLGHLRSARITAQLMTGAAGRNIAAVCLRAWRMAAITRRVRIESRGYRKGNAATGWLMTGGAAHAGHFQMKRVIEFHSEASKSRERLRRPGFNVGMTNRADGTFGIRKLLSMASRARKMTRSTGSFGDR